jgi:hypothetical protein
MLPKRIQRSRVKGSRLISPNRLPIICVSRPSKWGNPFSAGPAAASSADKAAVRAASVVRFRRALLSGEALSPFTIEEVRRELHGKNLACWCPLHAPCHADVLLEIANAKR